MLIGVLCTKYSIQTRQNIEQGFLWWKSFRLGLVMNFAMQSWAGLGTVGSLRFGDECMSSAIRDRTVLAPVKIDKCISGKLIKTWIKLRGMPLLSYLANIQVLIVSQNVLPCLRSKCFAMITNTLISLHVFKALAAPAPADYPESSTTFTLQSGWWST